MKRAAAILALIGIVLAVPVKQHHSRRYHIRANEDRASYQSRLIHSVSTKRALNPRFMDVRGTDRSTVAGSVSDSSDDSFLKRGKRTRHRRPKAGEVTKIVLFCVAFTTHAVTAFSPTIVRRSIEPLTPFGSGLCYSLPRARESLIGPSSLSGFPAV